MDINQISVLLNRYFEGETSVKEERILKTYYKSGNVAKEHEAFSELFGYFVEAQAIETSIVFQSPEENKIDVYLENYFEGKSTLDEERALKAYFSSDFIEDEHKQFQELFAYFSNAQAEQLEKKIELDLNDRAKGGYLKIVRSRMVSVAAALAIILASVFVMNYYQSPQFDNIEYTDAEAEQALDDTMKALAYLGVQFNKGTEPMQNMKSLRKTQILKY